MLRHLVVTTALILVAISGLPTSAQQQAAVSRPVTFQDLLAGSSDKVRNASIDLSATYTNEFLNGR